jgi:hypothetical protein
LFKHFHEKTRTEEYPEGALQTLPYKVLVGFLSFSVLTTICITGIYESFVGLKKDSYWISYLHTWAGFAGMLMLVCHIAKGNWLTDLKDKFGFFSPAEPQGRKVLLKTTSASLLFLSLLLILTFITIAYGNKELKNSRPESYSMKYGDNPFAPSEASTKTGDIINANLIGNSKSCAAKGCHVDIYKQWNSSAHRYSSTDVFYRKAEQYLIDTEGKEATRYCGGCHDPVALLSGGLNPGEKFDTLHSDEGSSCIFCHGISKIRHLKGSGSYEFKPPKRYIFANKKGRIFEKINNLLIKTGPTLHKLEYSKGFYKSPEYCATCHKQYIKDPNNWGWIKLQDQYGEWLESHYSGRNDKGFNKDEIKLCKDCHMPLVESNDPSATGGRVRSHRFIAANTAIPWLDGDQEQFEMTKEWLKSRKILIDIFEPRDKDASRNTTFVDNEIYEMSEPSPYVTMGEEVNLKVMLTNTGVGHGFPNGPLDIYQAWLEVKVVDSQNNVIFHSGKVNDEGFVETKNTRFFFTLGIDRRGKLIDKHNLWHMIGNAYKKMIKPGFTDLSSHKFVVPYWVKGDITVMARLRYRRFNKWFTDWVFEGRDVRLPIIDMARDTVSIPVRMKTEKEIARRLPSSASPQPK